MYTYVSLGVITIHWYSVYTYVSLGVITIHRYALGHSKSYCCFWSGGFLCYAQAGGTSATQLTMKTEVIASIFAHATSQKNCSTALPGSPICSIFHGIKRLCFERQNTLTINHAEFEPPQGGRHIIGELVSTHVHYAWMFINWNGPEGCGRRTRNRSTTWSALSLVSRSL